MDAVYAKLLVVESLDAEGNVVRRERRRMAIAAMGACRRAWFVMQRAEEAIVPADNPFAKMGLKKLAPGQKKTETPTATWDELMAFRMSAVKLGYASIATAALTASERSESAPSVKPPWRNDVNDSSSRSSAARMMRFTVERK